MGNRRGKGKGKGRDRHGEDAHRAETRGHGRLPRTLPAEDPEEKGTVTLRFLGAARTTTGSLHRLRTIHGDLVLECGMYQGHRAEAERWNRDLPVNPGRVQAVVLSHGHIDHSGALPNLVRMGFRGPVHCTEATADLLGIMLMDSARIQESDVARVNRKLPPGAPRRQPLYTTADVERTLSQVRGHPYGRPFQAMKGVQARFVDAGHIIGSAAVHLTVGSGPEALTIGFTGDLGRLHVPILRDPEPLGPVDYYLTESTYGDRDHEDSGDVKKKLLDVVSRTVSRGGKVLVPAFAVGRTQLVLYLLHQLREAGELPDVPIYVDSPMADAATTVFTRHRELYDAEAREFLECEGPLFRRARTHFVASSDESRGMNDLAGPAVIIAASGMCEGGRILHHLRHHATDRRNSVLFVGYQAQHTLGRRIVEGATTARVFGREVDLAAEVHKINGLSAHADRRGLLRYARRLGAAPRKTFLVHGDDERIDALADYMAANGFDGAVERPSPGEWHRLL